MAYTDPVKFTAVNTYGCHPHDENDVYTVASFKDSASRAHSSTTTATVIP